MILSDVCHYVITLFDVVCGCDNMSHTFLFIIVHSHLCLNHKSHVHYSAVGYNESKHIFHTMNWSVHFEKKKVFGQNLYFSIFVSFSVFMLG